MTNLSLKRKSAARVVAVQCLYERAVAGESAAPAEQVADLKRQLAGNRDEQKLVVGQPLEPHYALVETLLTGVRAQHDEILMRLDGALSAEWDRKRMSPLLVAILECAIFELFFHKETKSAVITDEYTRLARNFFGEAEAGFVHGALKKLAEQYG